MNTRIQELQRLIDAADIAYYTHGTSTMEDARYDKLKAELKTLSPSDARLLSVGASVKSSILMKQSHMIPMGSLGKAMNESEWNNWISSINRSGTSTNDLHASYKLDGGSISLEYKDGRFISAISRGDGIIGEDITANAFNFKGVPPIVSYNNRPFTGFIRGEILLFNDDWISVDPNKDSNPRNMAVGIARRKSGVESEFLTFMAFRAFDGDGHPLTKTETNMSLELKNMGFKFAPCMTGTATSVWNFYLTTLKLRAGLPYWIDGIVVKINDIDAQLSLGETAQCPLAQVAIKFPAEGANTTLRNVTLQVGSTGAIVPVANFDPVRIGGTTILNATLCNWENIETLGVNIGDTIFVIKAGDIIPRIMEVTAQGRIRKTINRPTACPVCGGKVGHRDNVSGEESTAIYCLNETCPAIVTGKIDRYLTSLDIMGIGENLIQAIVKDLRMEDASDLYTLKWNEAELADLMLSGKTRLGEKRAQKIIEEIEKKRELTISEFLGSLGIFGMGKRRVALIQESMPGEFDTLDDWFSDKLIKNADRCGVRNIATNIHTEILKNRDYIEKFLRNGLVITKPKPKPVLKAGAFIFCITGALTYPKSHYETIIQNAGHGYSDGMSKSVTHLVAADSNSGSNKLEKAKKAGVKVISESEMLSILES